NVDPEEAFVASVASCHMLSFLHIASKAGFQIESYEDNAVGTMTKNDSGALWIETIELYPKIVWASQKKPSAEEIEELHHQAHHVCFIANSIKTEVKVFSSLKPC